MGPLQTLTAILGLATVSGVNLYLTVLLVGLGQRFGWIQGLPSDLTILSHWAVLSAAGFLYLMEFVADKVPFVTPLWDGLHTFIRPVGGALLALGAAAELHPIVKVIAMLAGGTIALGTHGSKMGVRLLAHTSPEPASHSALSVAEDLGVLALLALAYNHPAIALATLGVLLLATALLLPMLFRALKLVLHGFAGALRALFELERPKTIPQWADLKTLELDPAGTLLALPCFARRVKGLPRFKSAFLIQTRTGWHLVYRRWFRTRSLTFNGPSARHYPGLLWDRAVFLHDQKPQILLIGREWRSSLPPSQT